VSVVTQQPTLDSIDLTDPELFRHGCGCLTDQMGEDVNTPWLHRNPLTRILIGVAAALLCGAIWAAPSASADDVAYLVNVTVRPGYNFSNADAALAYGHGICDKVAHGESYADLVGDVQADFATSDYYQGAYLINQAVNELCPALIWQLRNSAAHYRPPPAGG